MNKERYRQQQPQQPPQQSEEDGGRTDRLYVDLGCGYTHLMTEGRYFPDNQECLMPSLSYARFLFPPSETAEFASEINSFHALPTRYLHTAINRVRHPVTAVKWSPEGRRLITGSQNGEFTLWSSFGFISDSSITGHDSAVRCIAWSHNQDWMASGDFEGKIKIWTPQVRPVRVLDAHLGQARGLAFSPSDAKLVSGGDDLKVKIWDLASGKEERTMQGHLFDVRAVDWHPEKALVASGGRDNLVKLWNPSSRAASSDKELCTLTGHKNTINCVAFCPNNGNLLLSASRDKSIRVFDLRKLKSATQEDACLFMLDGHSSEIQDVKWHPFFENVFASGGYDGSLVFWSINGWKVKPSLDALIPAAHEGAIWSLDWHPAGHLLCTGSNDRTCKFWSRMLPESKTEDFYAGYTNKGSEVDILQKVEALPVLSRADLDDLENARSKREELLRQAVIPGIGPIGPENVLNQSGLILQPTHLSNVQGKVYAPDPDYANQALNIAHHTKIEVEHYDVSLLKSRIAPDMIGGVGTGSGPITANKAANEELPMDVENLGKKSFDPLSFSEPRVTGFVRMFDEKKGYGFIRTHDPQFPDLFTHQSDIEIGFGRDGQQLLAKNDIVVLTPEKGQNKVTGSDQWKAKHIILLEHDPTKAELVPVDPFSQYGKAGDISRKRRRPDHHDMQLGPEANQFDTLTQPQTFVQDSDLGQQAFAPLPQELLDLLLSNVDNPEYLSQILLENGIDIDQLKILLQQNGIG